MRNVTKHSVLTFAFSSHSAALPFLSIGGSRYIVRGLLSGESLFFGECPSLLAMTFAPPGAPSAAWQRVHAHVACVDGVDSAFLSARNWRATPSSPEARVILFPKGSTVARGTDLRLASTRCEP